jgi:hypothetical protein
MAHLVGRLTAPKVAKVKKPGMHADGGAGLYLQVSGDGESRLAKSWIFRFTLRGRSSEMGLGSLSCGPRCRRRHRAGRCPTSFLSDLGSVSGSFSGYSDCGSVDQRLP